MGQGGGEARGEGERDDQECVEEEEDELEEEGGRGVDDVVDKLQVVMVGMAQRGKVSSKELSWRRDHAYSVRGILLDSEGAAGETPTEDFVVVAAAV